MYPDQRGITARPGNGIGHHVAVILFIDPTAACQINMRKHRLQHRGNGIIGGDIAAGKLWPIGHRVLRAIIFRRIVNQRCERDITGRAAVFQQYQPAGFSDLTNWHKIEIPFIKNCPRGLCGIRLEHH